MFYGHHQGEAQQGQTIINQRGVGQKRHNPQLKGGALPDRQVNVGYGGQKLQRAIQFLEHRACVVGLKKSAMTIGSSETVQGQLGTTGGVWHCLRLSAGAASCHS